VSIESHDKGLLSALIRPVVEATTEQGIRGLPRAVAVLRAGLVLVRFGEWLLAREGQSAEQVVACKDIEQARAKADIEALIEMVVSDDLGAPYPQVE